MATLDVDDTLQLQMINSAGVVQSGVTWSSANTGIATVSNTGLVTGVASGTVKIRGKKSGQPAYSTITVTDPLPEEPPAPPPLVVTCPDTITVNSDTGSPVPVSFSATTTGGRAPITITYDPASGSSFSVGTTQVDVTATDSATQTVPSQEDTCSFNVVVTNVTAETARGPQSSITCPGGSVNVSTSASIQAAINANVGATTFCLAAGVHPITAAIVPKTGNTFVGAYGAIIDGTGWSTTVADTAAFTIHNQDIDNVTIKNLVIRNMPQRGIHVFGPNSTGLTVENNEITNCRTGINLGSGTAGTGGSATIRNNYIHHNVRTGVTSGGYLMFRGINTTWTNNEIAYNGSEQKVVATSGVTFSGNFVHHNTSDGIWFDTDNTGWTVEDNVVEDNGRDGIVIEISGAGTIQNNEVRRSGGSGIFLVMSKDIEVTGNTLVNNFRGIRLYLKCTIRGLGTMSGGYDLANDNIHANSITVGASGSPWANGLNWPSGECSDSTALAPYLNGSKNNVFADNDYIVPNLVTKYWIWAGVMKNFTEWQALGHDAAGSATTP